MQRQQEGRVDGIGYGSFVTSATETNVREAFVDAGVEGDSGDSAAIQQVVPAFDPIAKNTPSSPDKSNCDCCVWVHCFLFPMLSVWFGVWLASTRKTNAPASPRASSK